MKTQLDGKSDGRYSKKYVQLPYGIIKLNNNYYAVYKGEKHRKHLGMGGFGKIKLVQDLASGIWYALKIQLGSYNLSDEHNKLQKMQKSIGLIFKKQAIQSDNQHILMKLVPGYNLRFFLKMLHSSKIDLSRSHWISIIIKTLEAVKNIHNSGILHCDIKLENIMYDLSKNHIEVIDFGAALNIHDRNSAYSKSLIGSSDYRAPELPLQANELASMTFGIITYTEKTDIFSLGHLLKILMGFVSIRDGLDNKPYITTELFHDNKFVKKFLNDMTNNDPNKRPSLVCAIDFFTRLGLFDQVDKKDYSTITERLQIDLSKLNISLKNKSSNLSAINKRIALLEQFILEIDKLSINKELTYEILFQKLDNLNLLIDSTKVQKLGFFSRFLSESIACKESIDNLKKSIAKEHTLQMGRW